MHIRIPEFEKVNIRKRLLLETAIYGLLTAVYTSMFFFGALYPEYGIPSEAVERQQETTEEAASRTDKAEEADRAEETDKTEKAEEEIVYKSLLLEKLKEWF